VKKLGPLFVADSQTSVQILFKELRPALAEFPFLARCYSGSQRLSLPVFVRLREDQARVVKALNEGVTLLVMGLGFMLAGVGSIAPWIIPPLLGSKWLPALIVYPFISADNLTGGVSNLHASILYLLRKPWRVAVCRITHCVLFVGAALFLVRHLGLVGFGWAELVAAPSYVLLLTWVYV
jgi:O-antigen/teichoic acid export membrane protein